jgi:antitoxin (DNA-binding transcriptional repressor) of toxin-antitoxin stability system
MRTIGATEFKAKCLRLIDEVARTGESVAILKRGRLVARLDPAHAGAGRHPQDALRGTVETLGDILAPVLAAGAWEAEGGVRR